MNRTIHSGLFDRNVFRIIESTYVRFRYRRDRRENLETKGKKKERRDLHENQASLKFDRRLPPVFPVDTSVWMLGNRYRPFPPPNQSPLRVTTCSLYARFVFRLVSPHMSHSTWGPFYIHALPGYVH